jgi:hypothetical protein
MLMRFNKISLLCGYHWKEGIGEWKEAQRQCEASGITRYYTAKSTAKQRNYFGVSKLKSTKEKHDQRINQFVNWINHLEGCWQSWGEVIWEYLWQFHYTDKFHAHPMRDKTKHFPCKSWNHFYLLCLQNLICLVNSLQLTQWERFPYIEAIKTMASFPSKFCDLAKLLIISF